MLLYYMALIARGGYGSSDYLLEYLEKELLES